MVRDVGERCRVFVGRGHELQLLAGTLARARAGAGALALVSGEPGIGKTRLLEELAGRHEGRLAWGACLGGEGVPPFLPWTQVLRPCLEAEAAAPDDVAGDVRRLLASWPEEAAASGASRYRLFQGVARVLEVASSRSPLLVVLDDLQWADEASLRLLQFLAREVRRLPILMAAAYRDTDLEPGHLLAEALDDLVRHGPHLALGGLPPDELAVLVRAHSSLEPPTDGADEFLGSLHRQTGGNPFFAVELAQLLEAEGRPDGRPAGVPPALSGVRAVVRRRLARLPQRTHDLLRWAALAGPSFDVVLLAMAAGLPRPDVLAALQPALVARMVVAGDAGRVTFVHDLVREALVADVGEAERASRHWALGLALERTAGDDPSRVAEVAGHLAAGAAVGDPAHAASWAVRAAERATAILAHEDAAGWYQRALSIRRLVAAGDAGEAELLLAAGRALLDAGARPSARDAFLSAATLARCRADGSQLAAAALGLGAGSAGFEVSLFDQEQIDLLEEALTVLPSDDSSLRALLLGRLSVALAFVGEPARRARLSEDAIAMSRRLGDGQALAYAQAAWCDAFSGPDDTSGRLEASAEVVALAMAHGLRPLELLGRRLRIVALMEQGRLLEVATEVDAYARVAEALRQPLYRWYVPLWRSTLAMAVGDLPSAAAHTDQAERVGRLAHSDNARTLVAVQRFVRLRYEGCFDAAVDAVAPLFGDGPDFAAPEAAEGSLLVLDVARGDLDRARRRADRLAEVGLHAPRGDSEWLVDLGQLAEAAAALQHRPLAVAVHRALEPYGEVFMVEGIGAAVYGCTWHYLASTAGVAGWTSAAQRYARLADDRNRAAGIFVAPPPFRAAVAAAPPSTPAEEEAELRCEGAVWAVTYGGVTARVRDSKGLRDLAILLRSPGTARHVTELTGAPTATTGPDVDQAALGAYRRHLAGLEEDLAEADANHDTARAERLRHERDVLLEHVAAAVGLGGRPRRRGDPVERARKAVTARIRNSIAHVGAVHPVLGHHLANSVRTGSWCVYQPERPVHWKG